LNSIVEIPLLPHGKKQRIETLINEEALLHARAAFAMQMINNTCQFGVTGHPAISVPCGISDDLPIAIQIVGRHLDEHSVLRVADAVEKFTH
jgi:amidase